MKKNSISLRRWLDEGISPLDEEMSASVASSDEAAGSADGAESPHEKPGTDEERLSPVTVRMLRSVSASTYRTVFRAFAALACAVVVAGLIAICVSFPEGVTDPRKSEVARFYNEQTTARTGAVNVVCGIILDFRGFDTLGESFVLFLALNTVILLLMGVSKEEDEPVEELPGPQDAVPRTVALYIVPLLLTFGASVVVNGHISPGGGFSGGAVIGSSLILYASAVGFERAGKILSQRRFGALTTGALCLYASAKLFHFLSEANGANGLIPAGTPGRIFSAGLMLPLNVCVGVVVSCTMYALYSLFRRGRI